MKIQKNADKRKYEGMKVLLIKGIGMRNDTKTYVNGSITKKGGN